MSLLDIGCGWGFLLIEAAKKYKIHGTGITLSHEQYTEFQNRIKEQHLEDYLTVELMDYRDLPKHNYQFDRVVSVGMLEHVGRDNYQLFLDCVEKVLKPGGLFLLHFISALKEHRVTHGSRNTFSRAELFQVCVRSSIIWLKIISTLWTSKISVCIIIKPCFTGKRISEIIWIKKEKCLMKASSACGIFTCLPAQPPSTTELSTCTRS